MNANKFIVKSILAFSIISGCYIFNLSSVKAKTIDVYSDNRVGEMSDGSYNYSGHDKIKLSKSKHVTVNNKYTQSKLIKSIKKAKTEKEVGNPKWDKGYLKYLRTYWRAYKNKKAGYHFWNEARDMLDYSPTFRTYNSKGKLTHKSKNSSSYQEVYDVLGTKKIKNIKYYVTLDENGKGKNYFTLYRASDFKTPTIYTPIKSKVPVYSQQVMNLVKVDPDSITSKVLDAQGLVGEQRSMEPTKKTKSMQLAGYLRLNRGYMVLNKKYHFPNGDYYKIDIGDNKLQDSNGENTMLMAQPYIKASDLKYLKKGGYYSWEECFLTNKNFYNVDPYDHEVWYFPDRTTKYAFEM